MMIVGALTLKIEMPTSLTRHLSIALDLSSFAFVAIFRRGSDSSEQID